MGQTRYFSLAFFDFGDQLDTAINVQKEIDRFVVIDAQLYGLYRVFGNGVIDGWMVRDAGFQGDNGITVSVSQGVGVVNYMASETALPGYVYNLPPNSLIDIYVSLSGTTSLDRVINFIYSAIVLTGTEFVRLARVSTGANSILYIDNNTRDLIGFEEIINSAIDAHRHRGTPSKIDLQEEVRNQLPGARLEGIDTSKITSGRFDIDRIPLIDHNDLDNNGLLTHAALDSFVTSLSQNNKELLGEVASVNLLKSIIFWKYKYADADDYFINELAIIPGISPNSFIDFNASTANINMIENCISGVPSQSGIFTSVYWDSTLSFGTASFQNDVIITNDTVSLDRSSETTDHIADFSDGLIGFDAEALVIDDNTQASVQVEDGNRLGRLVSGSVVNYFYRKNFEAKNWDGSYDELVVKVKTSDQIHNPVYIYVVNGSNINPSGGFGSVEEGDIDGIKKPSSSWVLLEEDEYMSSFEEKVFDITDLSLDEVTQITIYTNDENLTFDIDDIEVRRTNLFAETGTIRFRYQTGANVVFHSIFYDVDTPQDTRVSIRVKSASSADLLSRSFYSPSLDSGSVMALTGIASEIEVVMISNDARNLSPVLNSLELRILTDADFTGFVIDTETEWDRGTLSNVNTNDAVSVGKSYLTVSTPINVDGRYFSKSGSISEINNLNIGVYGFSGSSMPISPSQARDWTASSSRGFSVVSSVVRRFNKNFLIADLNNNRVLEIDSGGNLVKGFGSTYSIDTNFYPLSAVYNSSSKILTIVFTKSAVVSDITKIAFYVGSSKVSLSTNSTVINSNKAKNKILEIQIDDVVAARLTGATTDNLSVNFDDGAFTEIVTVHTGMTAQGNSIFSALRGVVCFIGNFAYIDNIRHPVFVNETSDGNWIIGNSSVFYGDIDTSKEESAVVSGVIEIDPTDVTDVDNKLISSDIEFSDYTLGGIYEYEDGRFVVAGIEESSSIISGMTGDSLRAGLDPVPDDVEFRASAIDDLANYAGRVVILDKINNKKQVLYVSPDGLFPSDISGYSNGDMIVSESSFADASGRLTRIDSYGNITWNYGAGTFNIINDTKVLNDDNLIVSV